MKVCGVEMDVPDTWTSSQFYWDEEAARRRVFCNGDGKVPKEIRTPFGVVMAYVTCPECRGNGCTQADKLDT